MTMAADLEPAPPPIDGDPKPPGANRREAMDRTWKSAGGGHWRLGAAVVAALLLAVATCGWAVGRLAVDLSPIVGISTGEPTPAMVRALDAGAVQPDAPRVLGSGVVYDTQGHGLTGVYVVIGARHPQRRFSLAPPA